MDLTNGFEHPWYGYRIDAELPAGWEIENLVPTASRFHVPVTDPAFLTIVPIDLDDDRLPERELVTQAIDLQLEQPSTGATISIATIPVGPSVARRQPWFLLAETLRALVGARVRGLPVAPLRIAREGRDVSYQVIDDNTAALDGMAAHAATVDFVSLERALVAPPGRITRGRVIVVQTPYLFDPALPGAPRMPVVLVITALQHPVQFESVLRVLAQAAERFEAGGGITGETFGVTAPRPAD